MKFALSRLAKAVVTLFAIATLNFVIVHAAPGNPAQVLAGESGAADAAYIAQLNAQFGLDKPIAEQFGSYIWGIATLDFGYSYRQQQEVLSLVLDRLPATLLLTGVAFLFSISLGVLLGVLSSLYAGRWQDTTITIASLAFYATPLFWIALMGQIVFSLHLQWLPNVGYQTVGADLIGIANVLDIAHHLVLPALTLGLFFTGLYARMMRSSMVEVKDADFVKTAKAKGLTSSAITWRHVARNAILPIVTLAGIQAGQLVGGAVLTETVFAWPGIGRLMFDALVQRDYPVILAVFFVSSAMVILFNILTDLIYRLVDPRIGANA